MADAKTKNDVILSVFCPYLKREVVLRRGTWYGKILLNHPEVTGRLELIKTILSKDEKDILKYRKKNNSDKIALFKECPHLQPYNKIIKIALEILDDKKAVITTVHGLNNLPGKDMEAIT